MGNAAHVHHLLAVMGVMHVGVNGGGGSTHAIL